MFTKSKGKKLSGHNFLRILLFDEKTFYTHFYQKPSDLIVCGHESFEGGPNCCPHPLNDYPVGKEWMEFLV